MLSSMRKISIAIGLLALLSITSTTLGQEERPLEIMGLTAEEFAEIKFGEEDAVIEEPGGGVIVNNFDDLEDLLEMSPMAESPEEEERLADPESSSSASSIPYDMNCSVVVQVTNSWQMEGMYATAMDVNVRSDETVFAPWSISMINEDWIGGDVLEFWELFSMELTNDTLLGVAGDFVQSIVSDNDEANFGFVVSGMKPNLPPERAFLNTVECEITITE